MTLRDGLVRRGQYVENHSSRIWTPSLTDTDPEVPYLPLETPSAPPAGVRNYYLGGNSMQRVARGFAWVGVWLFFLLG
jgi:hypothetical protein